MTQRLVRNSLLASLVAATALMGQPGVAFAQDDDDEIEDDGGGGGGRGGGGRRSNASNWDIATPHRGGRPFQLDVHAGFSWFGIGLATGARFGIPLLSNGFVPDINNAVYLNFGVDFYYIRTRYVPGGMGNNYWEYGFGLGFPVALHWEFYFNENWSAYAELGFQVFLHPEFFYNRGFYFDGGHWFIFSVGGTYRFNEVLSITARIGTPYILFGLQFEFGEI